MSLIKAIFAASRPETDDAQAQADALSTIRSLLATEVLTPEDLATADVYDLSEAIRAKGAAVCIFTRDDLDGRFVGTPAQAVTWLADNSRRIGDRMSEQGNEVIDTLLQGDGLYREVEDDLVEGQRSFYESERGGYWYVDEVQGGERYTIAKYLTEDQARTLNDRHAEALNGVEGVEIDAMWVIVDSALDPVGAYDSYQEAFNGASIASVPYAMLPPLAERIKQAKAANYTVNERAPGQWLFNDPDGNDDDSLAAPYDSADAAWAAAFIDLNY